MVNITDNKKYIGYLTSGINLDHIPSGNAWYIIKILNLQNKENQIGVGLNLPSKKLGVKDLIKIENRVLSKDEIDAISLFCVGSTLSVIKDFQVVVKKTIDLPAMINNIIVCPNKRCVSHQHVSKFISSKNRQGKINLACHYCEQVFLLDDIKNYNI
ncbi:MAG: aspartate carbamoyltransferase regulatory subunit [Burkholderiales bacterium]|nr:aspartate carbamoyltransferase regulatory subunit [Burkholderiales bacterium]